MMQRPALVASCRFTSEIYKRFTGKTLCSQSFPDNYKHSHTNKTIRERGRRCGKNEMMFGSGKHRRSRWGTKRLLHSDEINCISIEENWCKSYDSNLRLSQNWFSYAFWETMPPLASQEMHHMVSMTSLLLVKPFVTFFFLVKPREIRLLVNYIYNRIFTLHTGLLPSAIDVWNYSLEMCANKASLFIWPESQI